MFYSRHASLGLLLLRGQATQAPDTADSRGQPDTGVTANQPDTRTLWSHSYCNTSYIYRPDTRAKIEKNARNDRLEKNVHFYLYSCFPFLNVEALKLYILD